MSVVTRVERVRAPTGEEFDARAFVPGEPGVEGGAGILLLQEIFGFDEFLRTRATRLAEMGYAVLVPDVFWRVVRNVSLAHDEPALQVAFGYMGRFAEVPAERTTGDLVAAFAHLQALPEVRAKTAVVGYCLGGRLAFELAAASDPDACVSYYGSGIASELGLSERVTCPVLFHFGGSDPYISQAEIGAISAAFAGRERTSVVVQEHAGHAFENSFAPAFSDVEAAAASWPVTVEFLARVLGP